MSNYSLSPVSFDDPSLVASFEASDAGIMSDEEMYETLGWDAVERGENPGRFVSENEMSASDVAAWELDLAIGAEFEADRYEAYGH